MNEKLEAGRMLLIVDPQIDFVTGTLPVPGAEDAMDALAQYVRQHGHEYSVIVVTCDRHPLRHISFIENGGEWPPHCVESSVGAAVWPALMEQLVPFKRRVVFLYKGEDLCQDEYSIFQSRDGSCGINGFLSGEGIDRIDICGLAGDVCVKTTLEDALKLYPGKKFRILKDFVASLDGGKCVDQKSLYLESRNQRLKP